MAADGPEPQQTAKRPASAMPMLPDRKRKAGGMPSLPARPPRKAPHIYLSFLGGGFAVADVLGSSSVPSSSAGLQKAERGCRFVKIKSLNESCGLVSRPL